MACSGWWLDASLTAVVLDGAAGAGSGVGAATELGNEFRAPFHTWPRSALAFSRLAGRNQTCFRERRRTYQRYEAGGWELPRPHQKNDEPCNWELARLETRQRRRVILMTSHLRFSFR